MKSKKILLGSLSTMALVATPIAAVVSCDKKDPAAAAGDKKADAFNAADLIKKIGKDDKGLIATTQIEGQPVEFYVSEADAKTETTVTLDGNKIVLPILEKGKAGMMAQVTFGAEMIKLLKDGIDQGPGTPQEKQAKIDKLGETQKIKVTASATTTKVGKIVVNKNILEQDATTAATTLTKLLKVKDGKGLYKFVFTPETEETAIPELTVESKKAFTKIFTDLGLIVKSLAFANDKTAKTITPTLTLAEDTSVADIAALKKAFGTTPTFNKGSTDISAPGTILFKDANVNKANAAAELEKAINLHTDPTGGGNGFAKPTTLLDTLFKDNMKIEIVVTATSIKLLISTATVKTPEEIVFTIS